MPELEPTSAQQWETYPQSRTPANLASAAIELSRIQSDKHSLERVSQLLDKEKRTNANYYEEIAHRERTAELHSAKIKLTEEYIEQMRQIQNGEWPSSKVIEYDSFYSYISHSPVLTYVKIKPPT